METSSSSGGLVSRAWYTNVWNSTWVVPWETRVAARLLTSEISWSLLYWRLIYWLCCYGVYGEVVEILDLRSRVPRFDSHRINHVIKTLDKMRIHWLPSSDVYLVHDPRLDQLVLAALLWLCRARGKRVGWTCILGYQIINSLWYQILDITKHPTLTAITIYLNLLSKLEASVVQW